MRLRQCVVCGRDYEPWNPAQKCCGSEDCKRELNRWAYRRKIQAQKEKYRRKRRDENRLTKKNTLNEDAMAAKQNGMSYGQYKAYQGRAWL